METTLTVIGLVVAVVIVVAAIGITAYKYRHNTKADLKQRK